MFRTNFRNKDSVPALPHNQFLFNFINSILAQSKLAHVNVYKEAKHRQKLVGYIILGSSAQSKFKPENFNFKLTKIYIIQYIMCNTGLFSMFQRFVLMSSGSFHSK